MSPLTASKLRSNIYRILDEALETGVPVEISRNGRRLMIVPDSPTNKLDSLVPDPGFITGDPNDLDGVGWADEWSPIL